MFFSNILSSNAVFGLQKHIVTFIQKSTKKPTKIRKNASKNRKIIKYASKNMSKRLNCLAKSYFLLISCCFTWNMSFEIKIIVSRGTVLGRVNGRSFTWNNKGWFKMLTTLQIGRFLTKNDVAPKYFWNNC